MNLFDVLKARAGIPVRDMLAFLFAEKSSEPEDVTVYKTTENQVYKCSDGHIYALKEE